MAVPNKIELKPRAPEVKESMSTPASAMAKATESLISLLQKINDLGDAKKAIVHAKDLYNSGDTTKANKAKELTLGIFKRLQQIGKAPEGLDIAKVQQHLTAGKYTELADSMKETKDKGDASKLKNPETLIRRIAIVKKDKPLDKAQQVANEAINNDLVKEINDEVGARKKAVDKEEEDVQKEFKSLLMLVEKKASVEEKKELGLIRANIEAGAVGEVDTKKQIEKLRREIKDKVEAKIKNDEVDNTGAKNRVAEDLLAGKTTEARKGLVARVKHSKKGEQVFADLRLKTLVEGMDKVVNSIDQGIGLHEAVRELHPKEIREVRALLSSLEAIPDVDERSPYYDEQYVEFVNGLHLGSEEILGLKKMLESVDVQYAQAELNRSAPGERGSRSTTRRFAEPEPVLDDKGRVLGGMELGLLSEDERKIEYEKGLEKFNELFEPTSDGGYRERSLESQLLAKVKEVERYGYQRLEQRESFLNINMKDLFDYMEQSDKTNGTAHHEMIDHDYYLKHGVAKLRDEFMSPAEGSEAAKQKKEFEQWWYQEVSFNQRGLAYEGLFERRNQSPRMARLNSLMEIIGVSTSKKGLANWMAMSYGTIDQQNNSYVNEEFMGKLAGAWTNQGVDFRLEDMLKEYREEISFADNDTRNNIYLSFDKTRPNKEREKASISVFDTTSFMQKEITDKELRSKLGIPDWWHGKYGTMIYKYSESAKRGETRRIIWDHFLEKELGVDMSSLNGNEDDIFNRYSLMFDLGFQYSVVHKQLHQMIGNASFQKGELELPGAAAEMHLKLDPLAYPKLFAPRFQFLNVQLKEAWALFDPGVRDYVTMAPQDYAAHFTEKSIGKDGEFRKFTNEGAMTIGATFLGEKTDPAAIAAENELREIFNGQYDKSEKLVKEGALWHWGLEPGKGKNKEMDAYLQLGVYGDQKSSFRRSASEVTKRLLVNQPSRATLEMMNWDTYCEMAKNPAMTRMIKAAKTPEEKWRVFAETFGEHSFNHTAPAAKRSGDHPVKYGVERYNKHVEAFLAWTEDPFNQEKFDALLNVPTAVNAGIVAGLAEKNLKFVMMLRERMGRGELGGGSMRRFKRHQGKNTITMDTSVGLGGDGDNEWPAIETEKIKNNNWLFIDPIQNKSIPESLGIGVPEDSQIILDLLKGQRAKGRIPDDMYRKFYREIVNGVLWEPKKGVIINVYNLLTLTALTDWLGPQLGITGYELRKVIWENTEKTGSNLWKYLSS
ncbi:MAG: hypothetical protein ACD_40C00211G0009 [uncultured bacterium]|nr:MAG: hypothetical protein ACD_40C00211G0009 [uncultured bacterium]